MSFNCKLYIHILILMIVFIFRLGVASTVSSIMMKGGGDRLYLLPDTGLNKYHTAPCAVDYIIDRASCVSSFPSLNAFTNAAKEYEEVVSNDSFLGAMDDIHDKIKSTLLKNFNNENVYVVTASSELELVMVVSMLSLLRTLRYSFPGLVHNVLITENGINQEYVDAMQLCNTSNITPLSILVEKGKLLKGVSGGVISSEIVQVRGGVSGEIFQQSVIENNIEKALSKINKETNNVGILHCCHSSDLGLSFPKFSFIKTMKKRYGDSLVCLIDMNQLRANDGAIVEYLSENMCVLVTGSKFFTAPPFAAALLIPKNEAWSLFEDNLFSSELFTGLAEYLTAFDIDKRCINFRKFFNPIKNYGLFTRWAASLNEMKRFYDHKESLRIEIVDAWYYRLRQMVIQQKNMFLLDDVFPTSDHVVAENALGGVNTIIPILLFGIDQEGRAIAFSFEMLQNVQVLLLRDLTKFLPFYASDEEKFVASRSVLVGGPVSISTEYAVLRIALSASYINEVLSQENNRLNKLEDFLKEDAIALEKISLIARYYDEIITASNIF